ncbi:MAG: SDR family oxidoreductase [Pseudomonadota bacterium]|nr:SDR family oxidoreductase [Pseudomonadota bacterium]
MSRFEGRTAIVTGSSRGIGAAIATRLSNEGANVVLNAPTPEECSEIAEKLPRERTLVCAGDIRKDAFARELVAETVARFGALDIVCANAGVVTGGPFANSADEDLDFVIDVNVKGTLRTLRAAYPELVKTKGCAVATSSVSGLGGDYELAIYDASKGAVTQVVRSLALEWGRDGVRVNAVNPSMTRTAMGDGYVDDPGVSEAYMNRLALQRYAEPEDIAAAVLFLASADAGYITGVNLPVDGGITASNGQPDYNRFRAKA